MIQIREKKNYFEETRKEPVFVMGVLMNNGYYYQNINVNCRKHTLMKHETTKLKINLM